jgi:host factor-I protein
MDFCLWATFRGTCYCNNSGMSESPASAAVAAKKSFEPLQDSFWSRLCVEQVSVSIYLCNGIRLQGTVLAVDGYTVLLSGTLHKQLVYKHAISSVMPAPAR